MYGPSLPMQPIRGTTTWSFVIGYGKTPEHYDLIRSQWDKYELRMAILMVLAESPDEQDREKFCHRTRIAPHRNRDDLYDGSRKAAGGKKRLSSWSPLVKDCCADSAPTRMNLWFAERIVKLLERTPARNSIMCLARPAITPQPESIEKWTDWVVRNYCREEAARQFGGNTADLASLKKRLANVNWEKGDIERGRETVSGRAGCAQCHGAASGLGPIWRAPREGSRATTCSSPLHFPTVDVSPLVPDDTHRDESRQGLPPA